MQDGHDGEADGGEDGEVDRNLTSVVNRGGMGVEVETDKFLF